MPFKIKPPSLLLLVATIILHACNPDDPQVKDTEGPSVEFVQASQTQFSETVDFDFNLKDNRKLAHVKVLIDNNQIGEKDLTLKDEVINFSWDSKTVDDGTHILKVITTDADGNSTENAFEINIKNNLLTITIPEH